VVLLAEPLLADIQLSLASMGALERIAAYPGITASELARQAFKTQQAVSQVTSRLERLGYVERRLGPGRVRRRQRTRGRDRCAAPGDARRAGRGAVAGAAATAA
jgi:DNA-binding MarR family transcriptional regulator